MNNYYLNCLVSLITLIMAFCCCAHPVENVKPTSPPEQINIIKLPEPRYKSDVSLEQALLNRRSIRSYSDKPLTIDEVSQLLWSAQGITDPRGLRTAPSAGALYPLEVYLVVGNVNDLNPGIYHYQPDNHQLVKTMDGDMRVELAGASLGQDCVRQGAVVIVFTGIYERTTGKYGDRGIRYVHIEVGHAAQNLCLQVTAMGLGAVTVGAFLDEQVAQVLNLPKDQRPLYIIPVGRK